MFLEKHQQILSYKQVRIAITEKPNSFLDHFIVMIYAEVVTCVAGSLEAVRIARISPNEITR